MLMKTVLKPVCRIDVWLTQKAIAKAFAESEFEQYRIIQDPLYQSSFGRLVANTKEED